MVFIRSSLTTLFVGAALTLLNTVNASSPHTSCKAGYFALTYDDGPFEYTAELLGLLAKNKIRATFFVNGKNFWDLSDDSEDNEGRRVLRQAFDEGHQIGSHTWSHQSLPSLDDETFDSEVSQIEDVIKQVTGRRPTCLRPPYGDYDDNVMSKLENRGYTVVNWNVDTKDYDTHNLKKEKERYIEAIGDASGGYITLSHDVYQQTTVELTESLIAYVNSKNLKFATVAECLGIEPYRD